MKQCHFFATILALITSSVQANCLDIEEWYQPELPDSVELRNGYSFSIEGHLVVLTLDERRILFRSVQQPDAPNPSALVALSDERIVVFGDRYDSIFDLGYRDGELTIVDSQIIRVGRPATCGVLDRLINVCPTTGAAYSAVFDGVIASDWNESGSYASSIYRGSSDPVPISSPDGRSLSYFGENDTGVAYLGTENGALFRFDGTEMVECDLDR